MADSTEKIIIDYQANVTGLTAQLKTVQVEMAKTEKSGVDAAKGTETAFKGTEKSAESLKTQLRKLQQQLQVATDPKDVERLAKAAGKLKDQIEDATNATKVFASESKFEQVGNAVGSLVGKIRNLDFKGAAADAKLLVSAVGSITFKDALTGLKDLGTSLLNVGGALVTNPIFLIGATVAIVATEVYDLVQAFQALSKESKITTEALEGSNQALLTYADRAKLANIAIRESAGLISKNQAEQLRGEVKNNAEITALRKKFYDTLQALAVDNDLKIQKGQLSIIEGSAVDADELLRIKKFNIEANKISTQFFLEQKVLLATQKTELAAISTKASADVIAKSKAESNELKKEAVKLQKDLKKIKEGQTDEEVIADLKDTGEAEYNLKKQAYDANKALQDEAEKDAEASGNRITKGVIEDLAERTEAEKKAAEEKAAIQDAAVALALQSLDAISEIQNRKTNARLDELESASDSEIAILDDNLKNRLISQEQYDRKKATIEQNLRDKEAEIKKEQFEQDKQIAIIKAIINTAVAVTENLGVPVLAALVAAAGAIEIALIASQPTPKFEKGGKVKGARHSEGGVLIEAEKDEWIINRTQSIKHDRLLESINKGKVESFISEVYLVPTLRKQMQAVKEQNDKSFARNIANSVLLKQTLNDRNLLESLKKSRKNDQEIAQFLVKKLSPSVNKYNW